MQIDSINAQCLMTTTLVSAVVSGVAGATGATQQFHECALYALCLHFNQKHHLSAICICMPAVNAAKELCPY